ncbi:MAG: response regulator [Chitinophagaceae bacterium]|nr:response regulator [Chitinophagaceae bacterium]MBL0131044.1 response regulator [Chitinophagaceae bacterium]
MPEILNILIVDDEPDICYSLSRTLSKRGFVTVTAHTLAEAEQQLMISKPSILLLDNHLPDGMGIDFAKKISLRYPDLKIIMITAHDSPEDRFKAFNNGIDFFLSKPFTITQINHAIDLVIEGI